MAQILAGYTLGGADMLRRAMGKKIQAEMDAQRDTFIEGCIVPHVSVTIEDGSILRIPSNRMLKRADGGEPVTAREAFEAKAEVIISIKPAKIVSIRSEEHTSELQSLMRLSYAVFCLKKKKNNSHPTPIKSQLPI